MERVVFPSIITSAPCWRTMKPHIQHSHRVYRSTVPQFGSRYYLGVAVFLIAIGLLYLVPSIWT